MRVLLDNCVPWRLGVRLKPHDVQSVVKLGWAALLDRPLLDAVAGSYDIFVTMDKSIRFQQRLVGRSFAVVILRARSNAIKDLLPLVPELLQKLPTLKPGDVCEIGT